MDARTHKKRTMSRWGIGWKIIAVSAPYAVVAIIVSLFLPEYVHIDVIPYPWMVSAGGVLVIMGVLFLVRAAREFNTGFNQCRLVTSGVYGHVRNPIYAAWILFIIPGIGVALNSWIVIATALVAYVCFRWCIREEEIALEKAFGDEYRGYRERVPRLVPNPFREPL